MLQLEELQDRDPLEGLEAIVAAIARTYRQTNRPLALRPAIRGAIVTVEDVLEHTPSPAARPRLLSKLAELRALNGWIDWDLNRIAVAEKSFRRALDLAYEAGNRELVAYLLGCIAVRPMRVEDPQRRLNVLSGNFNGVTIANASAEVWPWLNALKAGAYAKSHRLLEFQRSREVVETTLWETKPGPVLGPASGFFDQAYWGEELATYLLYIGEDQGRHAAEATQIIADALPVAKGQIRGWLQVDMAEAFRQAREPEEAVRCAESALSLAVAGNMGAIIASLRDFSDRMNPTPCIGLVDFRERLHIA